MIKNNFIKNQQGQTLLIILMVMSLALAAGVAISSRSIQSLKQQAYTGSSTDSFFAAEAGVEDGLKRLEDASFAAGFTDTNGDGTSDSGDIPLDLDGDPSTDEASYQVEIISGDYEKEMKQDTSEQIDLSVNGIKKVRIFFNGTGSDPEPIFTYFIVHKDASATPAVTVFEKGLFDIVADSCDADGANHPDYPAVDEGSGPGGGHPITYDHTVPIPYSGVLPDLDIPGGDELLLRIRLMCSDGEGPILIRGYDSGDNRVDLPAQYYKITSTGTVGGTIRKIEATKTMPALPTIFDFVLFSASETAPLTK